MSQNLIATVGSNPLPVVIVARHLKPRKLWLLCTKSTVGVRKRIEELLHEGDAKLEIERVEMGEDLSLREAADELRAKGIEWTGAHLNYTAGTKQMSVVVHELWREKNSANDTGADACYLNADSILYWDKGHKDEPKVELSLQEIARLHFDKELKVSDEHKKDHLLALSRNIQEIVSDSGIEAYLSSLPPVYGKKGAFSLGEDEIWYTDYNAATDKNFKNDSPWVKAKWSLVPKLFDGLNGQVSWDQIAGYVFPEVTKVKKDTRLKAYKFLATEWIEIWLAAYLEETGLFSKVAQSFKIGSGTKEFELDVVALKDTKIYTFSCTIDQTIGLVKSKALEAHHRTQRIGGGHAAFAVFSLSEKPEDVFQTIKEERRHGHKRARIFGIEHLKDTDKFRSELEEWLRH